jgi:hypothetical protein
MRTEIVQLLATTEHQCSATEHGQSDRRRLRDGRGACGDVKTCKAGRQSSRRRRRGTATTEANLESVRVTPVAVTAVTCQVQRHGSGETV